MIIFLPANQRGSIGQARPKRDQQRDVAGTDAAGAPGFVQREGNRRGGGVAIAVDIDEETIKREFEAFGKRIDDAQVSLVRDHASDLIDRECVLFQNIPDGIFHFADRDLEHLAALHFDEMLARSHARAD